MNLLRLQRLDELQQGNLALRRVLKWSVRMPGRLPRLWRWLLTVAVVVLLLELAGCLLAWRSPDPAPTRAVETARLKREIAALEKKLAAQVPRELFIVIDTAHNRVELRSPGRPPVSMPASCGSGNVLVDPDGGRSWVFETPRGVFSVQSKVSKPLWIKPDWAYLEAGEAIPSNPRERAVPGMLGDYALGIGRGYFIHGTLYKRMLGRNVSHGCIRLGDDDLKLLVKSVPIGTRVMIF